MSKLFTCLGVIPFLLLSLSVVGQELVDTTIQIEDEVLVEGYPDKRPLLQSPASVGLLDVTSLMRQSPVSLVPALNTMAGVRMEERSPGSYRLSVRGSLLRSPFGVRNIKVYLDEFPLTDAGGNTYLNLLDMNSLKKIELLKGPHSGLFGANTGGVLVASVFDKPKEGIHGDVSFTAGSYGLFHQKAGVDLQTKKNRLGIYEAYQYAGGYRENSAMERRYLHLTDLYRYSSKANIKAFGFISELRYQTPGGLTLAQYQNNPSSARSRSGSIPGAVEQNAHVLNTSLYGGLAHEIQLTDNFKHVISVFGMNTHFLNPTINNYETRNEGTFGTRTYVELSRKANTAYRNWKWTTGLEWQRTNSTVDDYGNKKGVKDTAQSLDNVNARQYFVFSQFSATWGRLILELGLSWNNYQYQYRSRLQQPYPPYTNKTFDPQWMPRAALAFRVLDKLYVRGSVSRGYSPPTIAEVRPSDNLFYTGLQPESGWNYEMGLRYADTRWKVDAVVFYYALQQAIVRRVNANGAEYFVNSGGTEQPGLETQLSFDVMKPKKQGILRSLELGNSFTYYSFTFSDYKNASQDYTGNKVTGVPQTTVVTTLYADLLFGLYAYAQYNYTSQIPLNDLNSVYASEYHLVQAKVGWKSVPRRFSWEVFAGADNLLNTKYSLGNDLNAAGGRYYNAAPLRNWYGGLAFRF